MDYSTLSKAQKINDEIKDHRPVLEHFKKWESGKDDPIEFIVNYLKNCGNLDNGSIRKTLALGFIEDSKKYLETKIKMLEEEFKEL